MYKYNVETTDIDRVDVYETVAILDTSWYCVAGKCFLIAASALGDTILFELKSDERLHRIDSIELNAGDENVLTLAIDVRTEHTDKENLVASDSRGNISLLTIGEGEIRTERKWEAHSFEAWTCSFDKWNPNVVYTGGDDTFLNIYDVRAEDVQLRLKNRSHIAGVTSVLSFDEHVCITGSYDENLRLFDTRAWRNPVDELQLGGGIWRIKPSKVNRDLLLCACMYKNFSVCEVDPSKTKIGLVATYTAHESICYGADWCPTKTEAGGQVMITCSFYDQKLCVSSVCE